MLAHPKPLRDEYMPQHTCLQKQCPLQLLAGEHLPQAGEIQQINKNMKSGDVLLRPLSLEDAADLARLANNEKISKNLRDAFPSPYTYADALDFINSCSQQQPVTTFAIIWQELYVGNISLHVQTDVYRKSAEIGYFIGEPYWGKGIATKAVALITDFGFCQMNVVRIFAGIFSYNPASMRVLEKNGYYKESIAQKAVYKLGQFWDEHRYVKIKMPD